MGRFPFDVTTRFANGAVRPGTEIFLYKRGTTEQVTAYTTEGGSTPVSQPFFSDPEGRFPNVWVPSGEYDIYSPADSFDPTQPWTPGVTKSELEAVEGKKVSVVSVAASNASAEVRAAADFVCDGVDDHVQIIEALAALPSIGGRVQLSEGWFFLGTYPWIKKDNVTFAGQSKGQPLGGPEPQRGGTLLIRQAGFAGSQALRVEPEGENRVLFGVTLRDFSLDGLASEESVVNGVKWQAARSTIRDVWITRWSGAGLFATSKEFGVYPKASHDNFFDRVRIDSCKVNGVTTTNGCTDNLWRNCIISGNTGAGLKFSRDSEGSPSTAQMIIGCYIYSNTGKAVEGPLYGMQFIGNRIQECNGGIYLVGVAEAAGFQIIGNIFRDCSNAADNTTDGINITSEGVCRGGIIEGNMFHTDPGNENSSKNRMRYGINIASNKVRKVTIGPQAAGYREATSTFGTGLLNNEGTAVSVIGAEGFQLIGDGVSVETKASSFGAGTVSTNSMRSARGTAEAPLRSKNGDPIARWQAFGAQAETDEGAAVFPAAARAIIEAIAAEDWTSAAQGASILFKSTTTGSLTTNEKFRLNGGEGIDFNQGQFASYFMRWKNAAKLVGRNAAGSENINLLQFNASNQLELMTDTLHASGKKLGLFGKTPIAQPETTGTKGTGFTEVGGSTIKTESTFTGNVGSTAYGVSDIVANLKKLGALKE